MAKFDSLIEKLARVFNRAKIPYIVRGGQAVLVYGEPRFTKDIDITIGVDTDKTAQILALVHTLHLEILPKDVEEFVKRTMVLPLTQEKTGIRVDIIFSFSPYERKALQRAQQFTVGKTKVRFASKEDTIIQKLFAGRALDLDDVKGILKRSSEYDKRYIKRWLKEFSSVAGRDLVYEFEAIETTILKK